MMTQPTHQSVLLEQAVSALDLNSDAKVVDGTFGRGGHSALILDKLGAEGKLVAFDKDPEAITEAKRFASDGRFAIVQKSFAELESVLEELSLTNQLDAVLFDLGVSSPQIDNPDRGFSFNKAGPLDMRMDPTQGQSAAEWLNHAEAYEIRRVLREFGEEKQAGRIAKKIIEAREESPITTTLQLSNLVADLMPKKHGEKKHPATRTFQAIRIFVNNELGDLELGLQAAFDNLVVGGRLVVISFHSLEDRIVKRFFKQLAKGDDFPKDLPIPASMIKPKAKLVTKPAKASQQEVSDNIRSRSAIMRVVEKL